jgi:hypothetical protein
LKEQAVEVQISLSGGDTGNRSDKCQPNGKNGAEKKYSEMTTENVTEGKTCFLSLKNKKIDNILR